MILNTDIQFMARALQLAQLGIYSTAPNPRVGCVIEKAGNIIGEGWHQFAGTAHAEVNALDAVKTSTMGATAYVTLEPCSHFGKTPPCANALVNAGISRVVYGMQDPNPLVAGKGFQLLRAAGIEVVGPVLEAEAKQLNRGFIQRMETGKPWVMAKTASSLDGRTAMASGESQWITGAAARADVQKLRAQSCAIITGVGTVLQDDPSLNVRDESLKVAGHPLRQPLRVILDSQLQTPLTAKVLQQSSECLLIYSGADSTKTSEKLAAFSKLGIETLKLPNENNKVDLLAVLTELAKRQCNEVMIEAGAKLLGAFLQAQLVDELTIYMAPTLLGTNARPLSALSLDKMNQQIRLDVKDIRQVGDDYRWQVWPHYPETQVT